MNNDDAQSTTKTKLLRDDLDEMNPFATNNECAEKDNILIKKFLSLDENK